MAGRAAVLLATVLMAAFLSAALVRMAPGFGVDERQWDPRLSESSIASIQARSAPPGFLSGFWSYLGGLVRGDWGVSVSLGQPVRELVAQRAGLTLHTLGAGLALSWAVALCCCLALEWLHRRALDMAATVAAGVLLCLPAAVVALWFLYCGGGPALALAAILGPRVFRYVRNVLAASARRPHVLAARARGAGPAGLLFRHVCGPAAP